LLLHEEHFYPFRLQSYHFFQYAQRIWDIISVLNIRKLPAIWKQNLNKMLGCWSSTAEQQQNKGEREAEEGNVLFSTNCVNFLVLNQITDVSEVSIVHKADSGTDFMF